MIINSVILAGNICKDPEIRYLPAGTPVVDFTLAINRQYKDKSGNTVKETSFIDCQAWAKTAELISQYIRKGDNLGIEGELKQDRWQDTNGNKRSKLKVNVSKIHFGQKTNPTKAMPQAQVPAEPQEAVDTSEEFNFDNADPEGQNAQPDA